MRQTGRSTPELVRDLKNGHNREENFRLLHREFYPKLCSFFRGKGVPPEECRDLTQEVFFSVYKKLGELREEDRFVPWLFTIARNAFGNYLDHRYAKKRSEAHGDAARLGAGNVDNQVEAIPDERTDALQAVLDAEKVELLRNELRALPEQMRKCVTIWVTEEQSYDEIAKRLGLSVNTVKVHIHNARKALARKLGASFGLGET